MIVSWMLETINLEWKLESREAQAAVIYFGHVVREERVMENDVMLGEISGKKRRGRQITRWLDNVNNIKRPSLTSSDGSPEIEPNGEVLPHLSPGVAHNSTAQGDKVIQSAGGVN